MGKANPPPKTVPSRRPVDSLYPNTIIEVHVLADGASNALGRRSAKTTINHPGVSTPAYDNDSNGKITRFHGTVTFNGPITIQTLYGPQASPDQLSTYGRGTTSDDLSAGNTTLGFHESCHRQDYWNYLTSHRLPVLLLSAGTLVKQYKAAVIEFQRAYAAYFAELKKDSDLRTDRVGKRK